MFEIRTDYINESITELQQYSEKMRYAISDIEEIKTSLSSLSQMEDILRRIGNVIEELESERYSLDRLTLGLNKIVYCYSQAERVICDNAEQGTRIYKKRELKNVDLSDISGMLNGIKMD